MEINEIMQLVGSFGFPIVMCILFWHYISTTLQRIEEIVAKNTEAINTLVRELDHQKTEKNEKRS